jgi:predicted RNA polymerase sigma factor
LATILDRLGEREKAAAAQARAIDLAPETSSHEAMRRRLEKYRAASAKPSPR